MSSFISDSAIGMGGNDSRGLIQQPLVDQEVISISDYSLEETHHATSNLLPWKGRGFHTVLVKILLTSVGGHDLLLLLRSGNLFPSR